MEVKQFRYASDNLGYLVHAQGKGIAIDAGAPGEMADYCRNQDIEILYVTNTHTHGDHTSGNQALLEKTGAEFLDCRQFSQGQIIALSSGQELEVLLTPGHTMDSVCFKGDGFVITGDTLFNATVGNCFSGDLDAFYNSLKQLMALPGDTRVFAGHDYVEAALQEAVSIEPGNPDIDGYRAAIGKEPVVSTIADELKVNPYIRFNAPTIVQLLKERNLPSHTGAERFTALMEVF
ncbi:MAG TPA: hydroxyacylglutathione hydrolase [Desulfobacteraceae bacterium]|nr:hydroxyacylglutathione hydrolase [Desulfobacteraceae bacterium]